MSFPALSVIVPTYNRARLLDDALATLAYQEPAPGAFEVIVVDDGSADATAEVVARHERAGLAVQLVRQANAGLNAARNRGAEVARGRVLCYLDDDVLVPPGWAAALANAFSIHPDAAAAAGPVRLRFEEPPPPWLGERLHGWLSAIDGAGVGPWLAPGALPVGANCAILREWWERLGGFRAGLDRRAGSLLSNGDVELFGRLRRAGGRILWCPDAWVAHRVPPERMTKAWITRRAYEQGRSDALCERPRVAREVLRAGRALPILVRGAGDEAARLRTRVWLAYCAGRIAGRQEAT